MCNTADTVKELKRSFRLYMNGDASRSMREKGLGYKLNWGIPLAQLKQIAAGYSQSKELAEALWRDDVRECKILATLLMPASEMGMEEAEEWGSGIVNQELSELFALNLGQRVDCASDLAFRWLQNSNVLLKMCAYHILSRLLMKGLTLDEGNAERVARHVEADCASQNLGLRKAVVNFSQRFADASQPYKDKVVAALKQAGLAFF